MAHNSTLYVVLMLMSALGQMRTFALLLDHLICEGDQSGGNVYANRLGGFQIDDEFVFCRLHDR